MKMVPSRHPPMATSIASCTTSRMSTFTANRCVNDGVCVRVLPWGLAWQLKAVLWGQREALGEEPARPLAPCDFAARWREVSAELRAGSQAWRLHPPHAPRRELAAAIDDRVAELRARMRPEVALASPAAEVRQTRAPDRPGCPHGGRAGEPPRP